MSEREREHNKRMHAAYMDLTRYWLGVAPYHPRMVTGWQTVEFIAGTAARCATLAAHYGSRL